MEGCFSTNLPFASLIPLAPDGRVVSCSQQLAGPGRLCDDLATKRLSVFQWARLLSRNAAAARCCFWAAVGSFTVRRVIWMPVAGSCRP